MAMRNYGVQSKCMLLKLDEFGDLCVKNGVGENEIEDLLDISYNINNSCVFMEFDGQFIPTDENGLDCNNERYFREDDIIIFELQKDTLFECYKDYNEIYEEIINNLKEINIIVDKDFVKKHFGVLEGSYYA